MSNTIVLQANPPVDYEVANLTTRPWTGCGALKDITGCRFSINIMADDYADTILGAIGDVDTSNVWNATDLFSTVYRGRRVHVVDAVQACVARAWTPERHITVEATFSKGCPGDVDEESYLAVGDDLKNVPSLLAAGIDPVMQCKYFLAPMGADQYMDLIAYAVNLAIKRNVYQTSAHYVSILEGRLSDLMAYFNEVMAYCESHVSHYMMQVTLSANSPSLGTTEVK